MLSLRLQIIIIIQKTIMLVIMEWKEINIDFNIANNKLKKANRFTIICFLIYIYLKFE